VKAWRSFAATAAHWLALETTTGRALQHGSYVFEASHKKLLTDIDPDRGSGRLQTLGRFDLLSVVHGYEIASYPVLLLCRAVSTALQKDEGAKADSERIARQILQDLPVAAESGCKGLLQGVRARLFLLGLDPLLSGIALFSSQSRQNSCALSQTARLAILALLDLCVIELLTSSIHLLVSHWFKNNPDFLQAKPGLNASQVWDGEVAETAMRFGHPCSACATEIELDGLLAAMPVVQALKGAGTRR
ncbi:unnamed protein product, partial [Symbiodinium sp. KB8]